MRAVRYCTKREDLEKELELIRGIYGANGYPRRIIERTIRKAIIDAKKPRQPKPKDTDAFVSLPYTGGDFYRLRKAAKQIQVRLVSKPVKTIAQAVCSRAKHHLPKSQTTDVVYQVECDCGALYVGQTERELQTRIDEHRTAWEKKKPTSAFGAERHRDHHPHFDSTSILYSEPRYHRRLLAESSFIRGLKESKEVLEDSSNRNNGAIISDRWVPIICNAIKADTPHQPDETFYSLSSSLSPSP
jgi:predicted GIY-YIG superfamily endonuclease